jgi:hypothetical protein
MRNSHSNAMIAGGSIIQTCSGLCAVLRKHVSQPSLQSHPSAAWKPTPSQRATSFAKDAEQGGSAQPSGAVEFICVFIVFFRALGGTPLRSVELEESASNL